MNHAEVGGTVILTLEPSLGKKEKVTWVGSARVSEARWEVIVRDGKDIADD